MAQLENNRSMFDLINFSMKRCNSHHLHRIISQYIEQTSLSCNTKKKQYQFSQTMATNIQSHDFMVPQNDNCNMMHCNAVMEILALNIHSSVSL